MGLTMINHEGSHCPVLICDQCGRPIHAERAGLALWIPPDGAIHLGAALLE